MANQYFGGGHSVGLLGAGPTHATSGMMDPSSNNQPLQFNNSKMGKSANDDNDAGRETGMNVVNVPSSMGNSGMMGSQAGMMPGMMGPGGAPGGMMGPGGAPGGMMGPGGAPGGMMGPGGMMMPWAAMMNPMMADPAAAMMMWGPWAGMGMMGGGGGGGLGEMESLPQARRETIKLQNAVLYPPPPNSVIPNTRERPPGCKTIFIGGLPENTTEEMLQEMFTSCGSICSLRLSKKNFAHVRFTTMDAVDKALYFSGYRIKIEDKDDKSNAGRLHVDFAQARDDLHEWECVQRQMQRENRHRERVEERMNRPPSPPTVVHFSDHEAMMLTESLKVIDTFEDGAQTLITWLDRGDCNRRTSSVFFTLIQNANAHVKRLLVEKKECNEELEEMKLKFQLRLEAIVRQLDQIDRVFAMASKQKSWDHFTKAQRKNLEAWRKHLQTIKAQQEAEFLQNRGGEAEMEVSDSEDESDAVAGKRKRAKQGDSKSEQSMLSMASDWINASQLRDENDVLKCQLEALKNEVDIVKLEGKNSVEMKDKQLKCMQMAMQGMQQQLLNATQQSKKLEHKVKQLQSALKSASTKSASLAGTTSDGKTPADAENEDIPSETVVVEDDVEERYEDSDTDQVAEVDLTGSTGEETSSLTVSGILSTPTPTQTPTAAPANVLRDARIISLVSTFLLIHPLGANIDFIWSYLNRLGIKVRSSELEELLERYPSVFGSDDSDFTSSAAEKRWKFVGYEP